MPKPASMQMIAANLGLSKMSVSVALRGRPGVSEALRAQIVAEAKRVGYTPSRVTAELMAMVRSHRQQHADKTIAFINTFHADPTLMHRVRGFRQFLEGAREQAVSLGYQIEEFRISDLKTKPSRLDQILKARGIRGVLIGPRCFDEPEIVLDWKAYSCVLMGETTFSANIHRVCNHQAKTMEIALTHLVALGYKRIGIELREDYEEVRHFGYFAGVGPAQRLVGRSARFFVHVMPRRYSPAIDKLPPEQRIAAAHDYENLHLIPQFKKWVYKERLDALLAFGDYDAWKIRQITTSRGQPLGVARLETDSCEGYAGVNQHCVDIGRTAMNLLRSQLHAGERGVATRPIIALVEGEWIDGPTAPRVER